MNIKHTKTLGLCVFNIRFVSVIFFSFTINLQLTKFWDGIGLVNSTLGLFGIYCSWYF
jgi:hypothetical protein